MSHATYFRANRKELGYRQDDIANLLGMARTTVVAIENGTRRLHADDLDALLKIGFPPYQGDNHEYDSKRLMAVTDEERRLVRAYRINSLEIVVRMTLRKQDRERAADGATQ
jgi:DNA-binding XRE family transcriptional regulator